MEYAVFSRILRFSWNMRFLVEYAVFEWKIPLLWHIPIICTDFVAYADLNKWLYRTQIKLKYSIYELKFRFTANLTELNYIFIK